MTVSFTCRTDSQLPVERLFDLALWLFDFPQVLEARGTLLRNGQTASTDEVEDYATGELVLDNGVRARIACSWNLNAGQDAVIEATFYGTSGGAQMSNQNGSFFDFSADLLRGQTKERLTTPPDEWAGRAAAEWVRKLSAGERFTGRTTGLVETASVLDRLYGRG